MARFERLAKELETIASRFDELQPLIDKVNNEDFPKATLVEELKAANLGFFALKLAEGYYDDSPPTATPNPEAPELVVENQGTDERPITEVNPDEHPGLNPEVQEQPNEEPTVEEVKDEPLGTNEEIVTPDAQPTEESEPQATEIPVPSVEVEEVTMTEPAPYNVLPDCPACLGHKAGTRQHPEQV